MTISRFFSRSSTSLACPFTRQILNTLNDDINSGGVIPVFKYSLLHRDKIAIRDQNGDFSYGDLFSSAKKLANDITSKLNGNRQKVITYLCPGDSSHVITQWAIWMSGNIAVPLSSLHPAPTIQYYLEDSGCSLVLCNEQLIEKLPNRNESTVIIPRFLPAKEQLTENDLNDLIDGKFYGDNDGLIIYTSGTTSKPKGVVYGFKQIDAQVRSLHAAWQYKSSDVMLHALPLHHVHGLINSVSAFLSAGATLQMIPKFDSSIVWKHLLGMHEDSKSKVNVFMGVPTMYSKLISEYDKIFNNNRQREYIKNYLKQKIRLMVSGSAPLPNSIFERWEEISGHRLLERYGMTEVGMALSNPYEPKNERTPGFVGNTLPAVSARIVADDGKPLVTLETPPSRLNQLNIESNDKNLFESSNDDVNTRQKCKITRNGNTDAKLEGGLQIRGNCVFKQYWNRPKQTEDSFTSDGWFITGDTAKFENGIVKILGRVSSDIIKTGGFKVSALEIETVILDHQNVGDVAVIGMPDPVWGEKIIAIVELKEGRKLNLNDLQHFCLQHLPRYQIPSELFTVATLTRNVMGKVDKSELKRNFLKGS